jgi:hypothetical protein
MKDYPRTSFFRVVGDTTAEVRELLGTPNLAHMQMADFQNRLAIKEI